MKQYGSALNDFCVGFFALEILTPKFFRAAGLACTGTMEDHFVRKSVDDPFEGSSRPFVRVREAFSHVDY
jgi:hypothetical protein